MVSYTITDETILVVIPQGGVFQFPRNSTKARAVEEAIKNRADDSVILRRCRQNDLVQTYGRGRITIEDDVMKLDGEKVEDCIRARILASIRDGFGIENLLRFLDRLAANPSHRAATELYRFMEHEGLPITPTGTFLAYKGVQPDGYSIRGNKDTRVIHGTVNGSGQILNSVNSVIEVDRRDVDDNCSRYCAQGLHAGSYDYATTWGRRVVIVEIDPADVVSIPLDSSGRKARVCKYKVIDSCLGLMTDSVVNPKNTWALTAVGLDEDDDLLFTQEDLDDAVADAREKGYDEGRGEGIKEGREDARETLCEEINELIG
jgi:hypothetical protein